MADDFPHGLTSPDKRARDLADRQAELRNYTPSARERIVAALADQIGGGPDAQAYAGKVAGGLEFTPAGLLTGAYDLARAGAGQFEKLVEALSSNPVTQPPEPGKEEFFSARRSRRETLEEAQRRAEKEARESQEYKTFMGENRRKAAEDLVAKRKLSAEQTWQKSQATVGAEEEAIGRQWEGELADRERRRQEMLSRSFAERHPAITASLPLVGLAGTAALTRAGLNKINKAGAGHSEAAELARKAGDKEAQAQAIMKADSWAQTAPLKKLGVLGGAPLFNVEARALPDQLDTMTLPPEAPARQQAYERMSNVPEYLMHSVPAYIGGLAASYTGSKFARPSPAADVEATRAYMRGLPADQSPQEVAAGIAGRDQALVRALQGPQGANMQPPMPLGSTGGSGTASLPRALMDAEGAAKALRSPPLSEAASNPDAIARALLDSPANRNFAGHHSKYQSRNRDGSFMTGKPSYPDQD